MILLPVQNKLVSAFSEYRLLHKQSSRQLPHNKLLYPPSLRYLPLWLLGKSQGALQCLKYKASYSCSSASHRLQHAACRLAACGQLCIVLCSDFLRVSKAASQLLLQLGSIHPRVHDSAAGCAEAEPLPCQPLHLPAPEY